MHARFGPFSFLVVSLGGWMNQHQQHVIEYLMEENRVFRELSSAINRSELVSEYRRIMPESSQTGIRDVDHPELKPTQCSSLLECDVVRFEARPSANSDLVCPVRGWNEVVPDCNGWSRI